MRLPTLALAIVLATLTLTTQIAAACGGGYGATRVRPSVLLVSSHSTPSPRSFALLSAIEAENAPWKRLFPHSYDLTDIVSLGTLDTPMTLTLVGTSSARVVTTSNQFGLSNLFFRQQRLQMSAIEIPRTKGDDVIVALRGRFPGARFHLPEYRMDGTVVLADGLTAVHHAFGDGRAFDLQQGTTSLGTHEGSVVGILTVNRARYLVADRDGIATTIAL